MLLYLLNGYNIYDHLATEQFFLENSSQDIVLIWQSSNTIVCGKHQNIAAEVNLIHCNNNNVQIARRITGGGTVYQDLGNVCFSFIHSHTGKLEETVNYKRFLDPIKSFLNTNGINAQYSPRNDLFINEYKISGNAQHVFLKQKRVLHHGTLLFNSDLNNLGLCLKPNVGITHNGVKSVKSPVNNIINFTQQWLNVNLFIKDLVSYFQNTLNAQVLKIENESLMQISKLSKNKFSTLNWVLDYSPKHSVNRIIEISSDLLRINLNIENGEIILAEITLNGKLNTELSNSLIGPWRINRVKDVLSYFNLNTESVLSAIF